ncbi:hypothetical protein [Leptolyngbya sp. FACHB-261]|uniref:hypothetical protein n=1 Tax=Leptolyngbya sp. FACHB-261 TaxID=2692806 RepID=UPI0018EF8FBF|nr:hypothetical protein [Leptolyngbya sp. FACHB-261]
MSSLISGPIKLASWFAVAGIAWSAGYIYNVYYGGELSWVRSMYQQKVELVRQIQAPRRLLILGGSGAHFTVDAKLMEQKLSFPVFNLGLDGPVGLDVILATTLAEIRPGDIVLLIPEYLILMDEDGLRERSASFGVAIGRPGLGDIPTKQLAQETMLLGVPSLRALSKSTLDVLEKGKLTGYYSDPIDTHGGPTVLKQRGDADWWQMRIQKPISKHAVQRIASFQNEVKGKEASLVLGLPWVYASPDEETLDNIRKTADALAEIAPLLYDPVSLNLKADSSLFGDTHYHLNAQARQQRSQELVQQLKPLLENQLKSAKVAGCQSQSSLNSFLAGCTRSL